MISDKILSLIGEVRGEKRTYWNNKTISALNTALAAAKMNESGEYATFMPKRPLGTLNQRTEHVSGGICTCPKGGVRRECPVHMGVVS